MRWIKLASSFPSFVPDLKRWYHSIHVYINEDAGIRDKRPFDPNNVLRTWKGFRKRLVSSFGGYSDLDRALPEWNGLSMQPGKIDLFVDDLIRLANELKYGRDYVKNKARVGLTTDLGNAWAMKTPHPEDNVDYLHLLRNTGHQLEDVASFNRTVFRAKDSSHRDKSDNRHTSTKKQRKERKGSGPRNPKPMNPAPRFCRPPQSEHAKANKDIAQTLIDRRKQLNQCSRCCNLCTCSGNGTQERAVQDFLCLVHLDLVYLI